MAPRRISAAFYEIFRTFLPSLSRDVAESGRETVQVIVWLVGLSTALLGLVVTNHVSLNGLSSIGRSLTSLLFVGVAVLGVLQRMVFHVYDGKFRELVLHMQGHLAGLTSDIDPIIPLQDSWDRSAIIRQLRQSFNLECEYLDQYDVPIDKCREIYSNHYRIIMSSEGQALQDFGELLAAFAGNQKGTGRDFLGLDTKGDTYLQDIRARGVSVKRWVRASYILFLACCTCFLFGLAMVGLSIVCGDIHSAAYCGPIQST
ncbi:MAG: hypothetical protein AB7P24_19375 [Nitrospira sp.]